MRRTWAAGAAIATCLLTGGVPAVAQSPTAGPSAAPGAGSGRATYVTGTFVGDSTLAETADFETWTEDGVEHFRGYLLNASIEWSDPRLPRERSGIMNYDTYPVAGRGQVTVAARAGERLEGPDGYWTDLARGVVNPDGTTFSQDIYLGGGGYEGLYAIIECGTTTGPDCEGYIFEGEMPPLAAVTSSASPSPAQ